MIYNLPTIRSEKEGFDHIAKLAKETNELFAEEVHVDLSHCGFFDANMAAPLAAVLALVADDLNAVEIVNVPTPVARILRKNRFLSAYGYDPLDDVNRTTLPFRRIQLTDEGQFADYLDRHMKGKGIPRMTEGLGKVFRQSIFEVFQNAVMHSESRLGVFVCGQFYPQLQRLDLTIADAGIGIRENVRRRFQAKVSSIAAIRWALQEGHSTKTGSQPGGIGLKFLKDFIVLNRGKIQIASRLGFFQFCRGEETFARLASDFPGTTVNLEINTADTSAYRLGAEITSEDIF